MENVYGWVNGRKVYSRDEYIYTKRGFGKIENDEELLSYASKVTCDWCQAGHNRTFEGFFLGNYALDEPLASITDTEYERLKELQTEARKRVRLEEEQKEWKKIAEYCYADNSVEEVWENRYGERKTIMSVYPHGDVC